MLPKSQIELKTNILKVPKKLKKTKRLHVQGCPKVKTRWKLTFSTLSESWRMLKSNIFNPAQMFKNVEKFLSKVAKMLSYVKT